MSDRQCCLAALALLLRASLVSMAKDRAVLEFGDRPDFDMDPAPRRLCCPQSYRMRKDAEGTRKRDHSGVVRRQSRSGAPSGKNPR